jgi:hypothetical protein
VTPESLLLTASALHVGFQATVTVVTYPALAEVEPARWSQAHSAHSRRITWVVAPLYLVVTVACAWVLTVGPWSLAAMAAVTGNLVAVLTTAGVAAPTHTRLGRDGRTDDLLARLLRADRARLAATLVALAAAVLA